MQFGTIAASLYNVVQAFAGKKGAGSRRTYRWTDIFRPFRRELIPDEVPEFTSYEDLKRYWRENPEAARAQSQAAKQQGAVIMARFKAAADA